MMGAEQENGGMQEAQATLAAAMQQIRSGESAKAQPKQAENDEVDDADDAAGDDSGEESSGKQSQARHPGAEYVEIDDEKIQARINYLSKQAKGADESNQILRKELNEMRQAVKDLLAANEAISSHLTAKEQKEMDKETAETLKNLRSSLERAHLDGDEKEVAKLTEAISDFKADIKVKTAFAQQQAQQQQTKMAARSVDNLQFTEGDVVYLQHLAREVDDEGKQLRPWLNSTHADFTKAVERANELITEAANQGKIANLADVMVTLDKEMRKAPAKKKAGNPEVLSGDGNLTTPLNSKKITLSDDEMRVARKMGLTPEVYKEQKALMSKARVASRMSISDFK